MQLLHMPPAHKMNMEVFRLVQLVHQLAGQLNQNVSANEASKHLIILVEKLRKATE